MPDYKETTSLTKTWRRASGVKIENSVGIIPRVEFTEEDATSQSGITQVTPAGFIRAEYTPDETFDLLDPETGEVQEVLTQAFVYKVLHSLYLHLAKQRDLGL